MYTDLFCILCKERSLSTRLQTVTIVSAPQTEMPTITHFAISLLILMPQMFIFA